MNGWEEYVKRDLSGRGAPTPEKYVDNLAKQIMRDIDHWMSVFQYGCNDPFWSDGVNLGLIKGHIIANRCRIHAACEMYGMPIPAAYYMPVPPDMDKNYMASGIPSKEKLNAGTQKERAEWQKRMERRMRFVKNGLNAEEKPMTLEDLQLTFL